MAEWMLTHDGVTKSLADWGMTNCTISEQSLTAGMFTATVPGDMLATLPWVYQDQITLSLNGVTKFVGVALSPKKMGRGSNERQLLRFADPWWWLGQNNYMQPWFNKNTSTAYQSSRVALGAEVAPGEGWLIQSIASTIATIVGQCNAYFGGTVMQLGTLSGAGFGIFLIPQRVMDLTYESALRQILAWLPDVVQHWDYTTTIETDDGPVLCPTLNLVQRASATERSYAFADGSVMMSQEFTKRDDLVVDGIEITYKGIDANGHATQLVDRVGATSGTRILRKTIDCTGNAQGAAAPITPSYTPELKRDYRVEVDTVSHGSAEWWLQYGDTGATSADQITVNKHGMELAENAPENAGHSDLGGCNLLWTSGGMPRTRLYAHTRIADVRATLVITTTTTDEGDVGDGVLSTINKEVRIVRVLAPVTDLAGTFSQTVATGGTTYSGSIVNALSSSYIIFGAAGALLAIWNVPQFDGSITITKEECDEAVQLGDVLNVTGADPEWEDMRSTVMGMTRELDTGTTTITTGVAAHLGLDEWMSLMRLSGTRITVATDLDQQAMGEVTPEPPPPNDLDDLVGPGSIIKSMLILQRTCEVTRADATYKIDMTNDEEEGP